MSNENKKKKKISNDTYVYPLEILFYSEYIYSFFFFAIN